MMIVPRVSVWLSVGVASMALIAALAGVLPSDGGPIVAASARGQLVELSGHGLYRNDSVFTAAAFRGTDVVTLLLGIPALLLFLAMARRGSLRGRFLLSGALMYFLYVYASMALSAAYNPLFLLYVALFSASFYGFLSVFRGLEPQARVFPDGLPARGIAWFLLACGGVTLLVWLEAPLRSLVSGAPPKLLAPYTTLVTHALDLAIIVPAVLLAGAMLLRGDERGYVYGFPLLVLIVLLFPVIVAQTVSQISAGVAFTTPELVGPIGGFLLLGAGGGWFLHLLIRAIPPVAPSASDLQTRRSTRHSGPARRPFGPGPGSNVFP